MVRAPNWGRFPCSCPSILVLWHPAKGVWEQWCSYHIPETSYDIGVSPSSGPNFVQGSMKENNCFPRLPLQWDCLGKKKRHQCTWVDVWNGAASSGASMGDEMPVNPLYQHLTGSTSTAAPVWMCAIGRTGGCEQLGESNVRVLNPWLHSGSTSS